MRIKDIPNINDNDFRCLINHGVIDGVRNTKGFGYNCFINRDLNRILNRNIKGLYQKLNIWNLRGGSIHLERDILRLQHLCDHSTNTAIDLAKVPLHIGGDPNELKAPLIQIPTLFNFLNNGSIKYTDALINQQMKYNSKLGYGLDNYFNGFETYYVNPIFFKYGHSVGVCHIPLLRYEKGTEIIIRWINKAFKSKFDFPLFFRHGDTTFTDLKEME